MDVQVLDRLRALASARGIGYQTVMKELLAQGLDDAAEQRPEPDDRVVAVGARATGFWSYAHLDDGASGSRIRRLAEDVKAEYGLLTGETLDLFIDRDLKWGERWRDRLDHALAATTFFIPVITPRYFASEECRKELLTFAGHARSLGVSELVLPLIYVDVAELNEDGENSADEAIALIASMQHADWRTLRLSELGSAQYLTGVNELATRLTEIDREVRQRSQEPEIVVASTSGSAEVGSGAGPTDEEPGLFDLIALGEQALPKLSEELGALTAAMNSLNELSESITPRMELAASRGFAERLAVIRQFATDLAEPAEQMRAAGERYAGELVTVDPAILTLIRLMDDETRGDVSERASAAEFFGSLYGMTLNGREAAGELRNLTSAMDEAATWSRDIRPPLDKMKKGLQAVLDGQAVMDEWERRARDVQDSWT